MHIWLVELKANLHKANFSYSFDNTFLENPDEYGMKTIISSSLVHPSNFNLGIGMLGSFVDVLDQLLKIVRNRGHG